MTEYPVNVAVINRIFQRIMMAAVFCSKRIKILFNAIDGQMLDITDQRRIPGFEALFYMQGLNVLCHRKNREDIRTVEIVQC